MAHDPAAPSIAQRALVGLVRGYRLLLSTWLGSACRFEPTCSVYSIEALQRHGAAAGSYLTLHRLLRCHPLCAGGHDAVPDNPPALFSRLGLCAPNSPSPSPRNSTQSEASS